MALQARLDDFQLATSSEGPEKRSPQSFPWDFTFRRGFQSWILRPNTPYLYFARNGVQARPPFRKASAGTSRGAAFCADHLAYKTRDSFTPNTAGALPVTSRVQLLRQLHWPELPCSASQNFCIG